ncbi:hypothetical protein [Jiangella muralis]|uniref:hypothetical protein n=1 Tax=Jiangella muralis TaxID=702383 RepID=UPI00069F57C0|nr:hypothetical protein [Jiangella muralis]
MSANDSVPDLVERALDELAEAMDRLVDARNAVANVTHHAIATNELLLQLRAATDSVGQTHDPETEEVSYVLPTGEAYRSQRRRRMELALAVAVIVILTLAVWVVGR